MKNIAIKTLSIFAGSSTSAFAAVDTTNDGGSFLLILFLAFLALIIWCQLLPAVKLFIQMLKGLSADQHDKSKKHLNGPSH